MVSRAAIRYNGAMISLRTVTRPMLASMFVAGGIDALRDPAGKAKVAEHVLDPASEKLKATPLPEDNETLVKLNGAVQVVGGVLLALNIFARPAALALAASLVPTTIGGHAFWKAEGGERAMQQVQFLKNVSMAGGLLTAALDTGGRPSLFWTGRKAASTAAHAISDALPSH